MRILIATGLYPPEIGGPATYSYILEKELPRHGFAVDIVPFSRVKKYPKIIKHFIYFFIVLRRGKDADVIYALDPVSVGLPSSLAALILNKRFFLKVVGDYAWEQGRIRFGVKESLNRFHSKIKTYGFSVALLFSIEQFVANRAEKIITPSKYLKKIVSRWEVDKRKIVVIPNAVSKIEESRNIETLRGLINFNGKMIVSVGRLVPWKGFLALIEIMPKLKEKFPNIRLLIVGDGPDYSALEKKAKKLKIPDLVILAGRLEKDVTLRYIGAADVFVLNTEYEGFSHTLLETMCVGTPVVTTNVGGNPELIENGRNGILVKYNNKKEILEAVENLLRSKKKANLLSGNARMDATQKFKEEDMVEETIKEFK